MPLTPADAKTVWAADLINNPSQRGDSGTNKQTQASFAIGDIWAQVYNLRDALAAQGKTVQAALAAVLAKDSVDEAALVRELIPGVVAGVLAALPADRDDISQDEVTAAVKDAFRGAFGS